MDTFLSRNNKLKTYNKVFQKVFVFNTNVNSNMPISEVGENEEESTYLSNSMVTKNIELITCQRDGLGDQDDAYKLLHESLNES